MTDLDADLEHRLREALHAVIPHLLDADDAARLDVRSSWRARRTRIGAVAAAVVLAALTMVSLAVTRRRVELMGALPTPAPAPATTMMATTSTAATTMTSAVELPLRPPDADLFLPTVLPDGFEARAATYLARTDGAAEPGFWTRSFVGTGESPPVLLVFGERELSFPFGEIQDMTTRASWPSYRLTADGPSGGVLLASGGLTEQQLRALADVDFAAQQPVTLPDGLTEVPYDQTPAAAYAVTWNGPSDRSLTVNVGSSHGVDALANGITWPIHVRDAPAGRIFTSIDESGATFVQVGLVVGDHAVNVEAHNLTVDEAVAVAESIAPTTPDVWARRVPYDTTGELPGQASTPRPELFSGDIAALAGASGPVAVQYGDFALSLQRVGDADGCIDWTRGDVPTSWCFSAHSVRTGLALYGPGVDHTRVLLGIVPDDIVSVTVNGSDVPIVSNIWLTTMPMSTPFVVTVRSGAGVTATLDTT